MSRNTLLNLPFDKIFVNSFATLGFSATLSALADMMAFFEDVTAARMNTFITISFQAGIIDSRSHWSIKKMMEKISIQLSTCLPQQCC
jgi:predicted ABC-class ATPase